MKNQTGPQKFLTHLLSLCLIMAQLASIPARADEAETENSPNDAGVSVVDETAGMNVDSANAQASQNAAHQNASLANGGTLSYCEGDNAGGIYDQYEARADQFNSFTEANSEAIRTRIKALGNEGDSLQGASEWYQKNHGGFVDPSKPIDDKYDATKKRYEAAKVNLAAAQDGIVMAKAELAAAQAACDDDHDWCTPKETARIKTASVRVSNSQKGLIAAQNEYDAARSAYRNSPKDVANNSTGAVNDTSANANALSGSHSVSGCGSNFDITTNTDTDCALSGPLFEADTELTRIANAGITEAKRLAADRADTLFNLELQKEYSDDYKFYEMAVAGGFQDQHTLAGITTLDQVDALSDNNQLKTKNLKLTISNIKTVGMASSVVKDLVCEQHDMSEADSKALYLYKAASATWLMAIVQDSNYYATSSNCRVEEELDGDENNIQISSLERAANVHDQLLENICLRVTPPDPPAPGYDWKVYGNTPEEAALNVKILTGYTSSNGTVYPPLKERCNEYIANLRGEEYRDKPRTREAALEMMIEAEGLAMQELMAKNEKIMIADANVKKGEQWVKQVTQRIAMMTALLAVVSAAQANAQGTCGGCGPWCGFCCSMCPVAAKLAMQAAWIGGTVLAVWLFSELMRAKSFLKKWKKKLHHAKYFHHLACNFETAAAEEADMAELGQRAKENKQIEIEKARQNAIKGYNDDVMELVTQENQAAQTSMLELLMDMVVSPVYASSDVTARPEDENTPTSADNATHDQKRNVYSNTNALNVSEGTESFRYFLVQRNLQFQNHANDITNQPEHTRSDPKISNAGSKPKNINPPVIRGIEELAKYHLDGKVLEALEGLRDEEKTGMPTPETRYITIQNARMLIQENITALGGGLTEVAINRDQVVDLLTETRKRLGLGTTGIGDTTLIPNSAPQPVCMVGDLDNANFDPTCGCKESGSCTSFEYPKFNPTTPDALKTQGLLATDTANNLMSGNLSGAAVNGGRLAGNSKAVRDDLLGLKKKLDTSANKNSKKSSSSDSVTSAAQALTDATEGRATSFLNNLGVSQNGLSNFSRARGALLGNSSLSDLTSGNAVAGDATGSDANSSSRRRGSLGRRSKSGNKKDEVGSEVFSLAGSGGKLDLEGLSDEEKRRLGLLGSGGLTNSAANANAGAHSGHVRRVNSASSSSKGGSGDGIHKNRNSSLFNIISRRYKKTAFPLFLR